MVPSAARLALLLLTPGFLLHTARPMPMLEALRLGPVDRIAELEATNLANRPRSVDWSRCIRKLTRPWDRFPAHRPLSGGFTHSLKATHLHRTA